MAKITYMPKSLILRSRLESSLGLGLDWVLTGPLRIWLLAVLFTVPGLWLLLHGNYSALVFLITTGGLLICWFFEKQKTLVLMLVFLFLLGDLRRMVNTFAGFPRLDPMLLVGPLFIIYVALPLILSVRLRDKLSGGVFTLTVLMLLGVANPKQGPIFVGLSGALFFLIPMCWFWVARRYATEALVSTVIYKAVVPIGVLAALLGLGQTYVGFLPWERAWIKHALENGYTALQLAAGVIRPFGFSVNSVEYATLLMITIAFSIAAIMSGRRAYALLLPILLPALVLAGSRSPFVKLLLTAVILWAVRGRSIKTWLPRILLGFVVGVAGLLYTAKEAASNQATTTKTTTANAATSHVTQGLAHPLDKKYSTAGAHSSFFVNGLALGFKNPIGFGLGIVTLGAGKFGADTSTAGSTEVDVSDVFVALGFVGGFVYLFVIGAGFWAAARYVRSGPKTTSYALIGFLTCMLGAWVPLGQYAIGPLLWFCLGFLARQQDQRALAPKLVRVEEEVLVA